MNFIWMLLTATEGGENTAANGGALYVIGNGTQILNCNFTTSIAKNGSALYVEGNDCKLYNSNVTNNIADENGGVAKVCNLRLP